MEKTAKRINNYKTRNIHFNNKKQPATNVKKTQQDN